MIRVKVFGIKEIFGKFIWGLAVCLIIYFVFSIFLKFMMIESKSFAVGIVEENMNSDEIFVKGDLNINLLQSELGLDKDSLKKGIISDSKEEIAIIKQKVEDDKLEEIPQKITSDERFLASSEVKMWDRPKTYKVTKMSSRKNTNW